MGVELHYCRSHCFNFYWYRTLWFHYEFMKMYCFPCRWCSKFIFIFFSEHFSAYPRSPVIAAIGSRHTVTCTPRLRPFDWYRGNTALSSSPGECDCDIESLGNLTFRNFQPGEAGTYSCRVNLGNGRLEGCEFKVLVPGELCYVLIQPSPISILLLFQYPWHVHTIAIFCSLSP